MNKILVHKKHPKLEAICSELYEYKDYGSNDRYVYIEVDSETLCLYKLKYRMWPLVDGCGKPFYSDMPTYVLENFT